MALWKNRIFFTNLQKLVHPAGEGGFPPLSTPCMLKGKGGIGGVYKVL